MAEISNYLENAIINATLRATTFTSPSTVYVSLHTADPTDAGTGTEVSGGSYARKTATFGAPSNGVSTTTANGTTVWTVASAGSETWTGTTPTATTWSNISSGNSQWQ
jgi:hypothetical protein